MATYNTYTAEQERFLSVNAPLLSRKELTELFNRQFKENKSILAIKSWCNNRGLNSSNTGRFEPGNRSWQTGLKGEDFKRHYSEQSLDRMTQPMLAANKTAKLGDEYYHCGTIYVLTSIDYSLPFDKRRKPKRRVVWEQAHGTIPNDCCIIHLDGDPLNCELDNLYCLPLRLKGIMAKQRWFTDSREHTLAAIKLCELVEALRKFKENEADDVG